MGYNRSIVMMITGARGSGKSLFMTKMAIEEMMRGKTVWSNMPVKLSKKMADKYGVPKLKSIPLDLDAFYALSAELHNGVVCIDEAQNLSDSRSSLSLKNRLLNAIVAQVRKRSLNVYYTVQDSGWVDVRLRFAADVEVQCYDLGYSPWGRKNHVDWGNRIRCRYIDRSGYITGTPFKCYRSRIIKGNRFWDCYDTTQVTDLEEAFTSVKLDLKERVISNKENDSFNLDYSTNIVLGLLNKGKRMASKEIMDAASLSINQWNLIKKYIFDYGVESKIYNGMRYYTLSGGGVE